MPPRGHARYTTRLCLPTPSFHLSSQFDSTFDTLEKKAGEPTSPTGNQRKMHYDAKNSFPSSTTLEPPSFFFIVTPLPSRFLLLFLFEHTCSRNDHAHYFRVFFSSSFFLGSGTNRSWIGRDKRGKEKGNERIGDVDQECERFHGKRIRNDLYLKIYNQPYLSRRLHG